MKVNETVLNKLFRPSIHRSSTSGVSKGKVYLKTEHFLVNHRINTTTDDTYSTS